MRIILDSFLYIQKTRLRSEPFLENASKYIAFSKVTKYMYEGGSKKFCPLVVPVQLQFVKPVIFQHSLP